MSTAIIPPISQGKPTEESGAYQVLDDGYCFHGYDRLPVFCSFLPGIGGLEGVPLWAMYLNRGQGVVSFGMRGKDNAVMEFYPATTAWQLAPLYGFRTFVRVGGRVLEPFGSSTKLEATRRMVVRPHSLEIVEVDHDACLETTVTYVSVAQSINPALLRSVRFRNLGREPLAVEILDGMPVIVPAGVNDFSLKKMRRITEAFCQVTLLDDRVALFAPPVSTQDSADVQVVRDATFYGAWSREGDRIESCAMVVDPDVVFGAGEDFTHPHRFAAQSALDLGGQNWNNRLPCAFAHRVATIAPGGELRIDALAGYAHSRELLAGLVGRVIADFDAVHAEARVVIDRVIEPATAATALPELDGYVRQNFLDNVMRGGVPVLFPSASGDQIVHAFTRRHGDMERDYNDFDLPPYPYSEGSGNFRDILQNRRNDIFLQPGIDAAEIRYFLSLIQPDGYNPLAIRGTRWRAESAGVIDDLLPADLDPGARRELATIVTRDFMPGEIALWAAMHLPGTEDRKPLLDSLLARCSARVRHDAPHEGFWIDHWIYLLDLLEAYQGIFPDRLARLMAGQGEFPWADCTHGLLRRGTRHELEPLAEPVTLPPATLLVRLCALVAVKALTLDPEGRGIEMEAGRPGWNDALNGLPGLGGSSTCETAALCRLCDWLLENWPDSVPASTLSVPTLLLDLFGAARALCGAGSWDHPAAVAAREDFRRRLYAGEARQPATVGTEDLRGMVAAISGRAARGIEAARVAGSPLVHTYFRREADEALSLPLFLEGQVHLLRLGEGRSQASAIHRAVRASELFDRGLAMYKVNASLKECPHSIGRARTFSPGVYENESIWLHMSYKYLLEILRSGLHEEFFKDSRTMLVPFMNPGVYGRSILENSSFLGSSSCPEQAMQGRGYVARLSGSTAEFIHIWLFLTVGERPFRMESGRLAFRPNPVLPADWFRPEPSTVNFAGETVHLPAQTLATGFLGTILLVYHNPQRLATFGPNAARPVSVLLDGAEVDPDKGLVGEAAERIRSRNVRRIDIHLG